MKVCLTIFMLLFALNSYAHKQVVVIPIGEDPQASKCSIVGVGVVCLETGIVRVPLNIVFDCTLDASFQFDIHYTDTGSKLILEIGLSQEPKIQIRFSAFSFLSLYSVGIYNTPAETNFTDYTSFPCQTPTLAEITYLANFIAAGKEWRIAPIFSITEAPWLLESIIFEQVL